MKMNLSKEGRRGRETRRAILSLWTPRYRTHQISKWSCPAGDLMFRERQRGRRYDGEKQQHVNH